MRILRRLVVLASWAALAAGLVLTGKLGLGGDRKAPEPVLPETALRLTRLPAELEFTRPGPFRARLGLWVRSDHEILAASRDLERADPARAGSVLVTIEREGAPAIAWQVAAAGLAIADSVFKERESFLLLAEKTLENSAAGPARVEMTLGDGAEEGPLAARRDGLGLLLGPASEDLVPYVAKELHPGLLLLGGIAGVFGHLFLLLGRLLVPFRAEALPDEIF